LEKPNVTQKTGHLSNKLFLIQCEWDEIKFCSQVPATVSNAVTKNKTQGFTLQQISECVYLFDDEHKEIRQVAQIEWKARVGRSGADSQYTCLSILVKRTDENNEEITDADDETYFINDQFHEMIKAAPTPYNENLLFVNNDAV
jgi:UDP-N-acetylenolpyruvoylglucosamine reductase